MESFQQHISDLSNEFVFQTSRSSGPGGQNVNKVNSRVELRFNIKDSTLLTDRQKEILLKKLETKLTSDGLLLIVSQEERSQFRNKEIAIEKLYTLLAKALKPVKKRKSTRPTRASIEKRIQSKKRLAEKKSRRGRIDH
ncbi:alternative ribosome rescue aminoacyl-tRNA hydrolase ArfB [Sunxiuqinia sp. A32]|uniref:alternative ribosome rescue aminoacyl-tRNA hydrolase ArfB n=1 Tax=Sunxiuqinia sp. A32 TaxID=3461496 RepID=UPI00404538F6